MLFYSVIILVVLCDQLVKLWVVNNFFLHESLAIIPGFFNLTYVTNTGAAFGILAGEQALWRQLFFTVIGIAAMIFIFILYRREGAHNKLYATGLAMVGGGAIGNLIDRVRLGSVVDFLDFYVKDYHWPAFNVADSGIAVGVGIVLLAMYRMEKLKEIKAVTQG